MAENGFAAERLEIDVTEGAVVADFATARVILSKLKEHGVKVALDNFGTGHTSLRQLRELPFDRLKIDRSFVKTMSEDKESAGLVRAMVAMARHLNLDVMAEGVETPETAATLAGLGCTWAQGHYFGKAAPANVFYRPKPKTATAPAQAKVEPARAPAVTAD
jgi:EAL domain-containing protein (putative c-di-GMP-specific phosphodiesterase class I)